MSVDSPGWKRGGARSARTGQGPGRRQYGHHPMPWSARPSTVAPLWLGARTGPGMSLRWAVRDFRGYLLAPRVPRGGADRSGKGRGNSGAMSHDARRACGMFGCHHSGKAPPSSPGLSEVPRYIPYHFPPQIFNPRPLSSRLFHFHIPRNIPRHVP